ncbi:ABC transporter substrate-binding protein [Actinokineospora cianjurensis]|uniref:Iron complex transport system substrate-binding protein n=1 Tax=Actinokineospora cianjurensis TaxID=585224 RepID=A0A421AWE8_9PSEU|nr:ABC transporter substrate-binding protein [Actinokineospora cianjurensis]RLK53924.1 iron complex transport system substrate-binding protein [Actinokineospora cianjurensis]
MKQSEPQKGTSMVDISPRPARPFSRRLFLSGSAAGALTLGLTACGSSDTPAPATGQGGAPTSGAAGAGFPLTIEGAEGKAVIPSLPGRVLTVGFMRDVDEAVSLGVVPIAITPQTNFDSGLAPWVEARLGGAKAPQQIEVEDNLPFEKITELAPDLILATDSYTLADDFANLTAIAPTLSYQDDVAEDTWQTRAKRIGAALGKADAAEKAIADVESRIAAAKDKNKAALEGKTFTFSLLNAEGELATVVLPTDASARFLSQLGLTLSDQVTSLPQAGPAGRAVVAKENTKLLDADVVLFSFRSEDERKQVEGDRLFQALPAVKRGAYVALEVGEALSLAFPSTLSIPFALEKIVPKVVAAATKA